VLDIHPMIERRIHQNVVEQADIATIGDQEIVSVDEPPREALLESRGELVIDLDGDAPIQTDRVANRRHEGTHAGAWLEAPVRALELGQRDHALGALRKQTRRDTTLVGFDPSGLNRTLGTRPRASSRLGEERSGPARLQTFGRSREGGSLPSVLPTTSSRKPQYPTVGGALIADIHLRAGILRPVETVRSKALSAEISMGRHR